MPRTKTFDRQEVLQSAIDLFWSKGFKATSMQDLVDHLGISRSSLYETFESKEKLYIQALQFYRDEGYQRIISDWNDETGFIQNIRNMLMRISEEAKPNTCTNGCFLINASIETAPVNKEIQFQINDNQERIIAFFKEKIIEAKLSGDLPSSANANELSSLIYNTHAGLQVMARSNSDSKTIKNVISALLSSLN